MAYENYEEELELLREIENSLSLTNTSFTEARGHWDRKLMANIVAVSEADNYDDARLEWRATGRVFRRSRNVAMNDRLEAMAEEWGHPVGHCICGHSIVYHYEIENTLNGNITVLGSDHIENYHIARRIMLEENYQPHHVEDSDVNNWRKNAEADMTYKEFTASDNFQKHQNRVNLLSEIDSRFNCESFYYKIDESLLTSIDERDMIEDRDITLEDLFDIEKFYNIDLLDYIKIASGVRFKKTPSHLNNDDYLVFSSIIYRNNKAMKAKRKPPASLLSDMSEMIAHRRDYQEIIDEEKDLLVKAIKLYWIHGVAREYCAYFMQFRASAEHDIWIAKERKEEIAKQINSLTAKITGFTNKELLESMTDTIREQLTDYGVIDELQSRDDDFVYHDNLSFIFSEDTSALIAGKRLLNPVITDLEHLQIQVENLSEQMQSNDLVIKKGDKLDELPPSEELRSFNDMVCRITSQVNNISNYQYGFNNVSFSRWKRYLRKETEMMSDLEKQMYIQMGNDLANDRTTMTRFRLQHSQRRYERLITTAREITAKILAKSKYQYNSYSINIDSFMPKDNYQEIVLNALEKLKPSVEGLNTEQNIQEVN